MNANSFEVEMQDNPGFDDTHSVGNHEEGLDEKNIDVDIVENPYNYEDSTPPNNEENSAYFYDVSALDNNAVGEVSVPSVETDNDTKPKLTKERWDKRVEYTFNIIGFVVGLGNIWKFSLLCYKYGGGVFIPVYTLCYIFVGLPLFLLSVYMGQFTSRGCIECWGNCKILKAVGVGEVAMGLGIVFTYSMFIVWAMKYFVLSFFNPVPWSNSSVPVKCNQTCELSADLYFRGDGFHVRESTGIGNLGRPQWEFVLTGFLTWLLFFVILLKGLKFSGKTVYFTVCFPYLGGIILLAHGINLPGSSQGLADYVSTHNFQTTFQNFSLWADAGIQILFSLSLAQGGLQCLSSFNDLRSNLVMNAVVVTLIDYCSSLLFGVVVFSYVGYVKYGLKQWYGYTWDGIQLLFIIVPQALSETNIPGFWSAILYLMLITLAFDVAITLIRTTGLALYEGFPKKIPYSRVIYINLGICTFGFLTTLAMSTSGGVYFHYLINYYGNSWTLTLISLISVVLIMAFYGGVEIVNDIEYMLKNETKSLKVWKYVKYYFLLCWYCITPIFLLFLLIAKWTSMTTITFLDSSYPPWSIAMGWLIGLTIPGSILVTWIVYFANAKGSIQSRFQYLKNSKPGEPLWSIASTVEMEELMEIRRKSKEKDIEKQ